MSSEKENPASHAPDIESKNVPSSPSERSAASDEQANEKSYPEKDALASIQPGPLEAQLELKKLDSKVVESEDKSTDPFAHLPDDEAAILRRQVETPDVEVGYFSLFRYASRADWLIFSLAFFAAVVAGAAMPLMTVSTTKRKKCCVRWCS